MINRTLLLTNKIKKKIKESGLSETQIRQLAKQRGMTDAEIDAKARELGITAVLSHPEGGILSALGIGLADITRQKSCGIEQTLNEAAQKYASQRLDELQQAATEELVEEGLSADRITATRTLDMRYRGVDSVLSIPWGGEEEVIALFEAEHQRRYGYIHSNRRLEIVAAHIEVIGQDARSLPKSEQAKQQSATAVGRTSAYFDEGWIDAPLFERHRLAPGDRIEGPAIITEDIATTVIECGWKSEVLTQGELLTTEIANPEPRRGSAGSHSSTTTSSDWSKVGKNDPGSLEVFNNLFASIAKQMGVTLRNTAISVNVKERLDFSCAVFTADGRLVANAPHVPVHLGAMEETVRQTIATHSNIRVGDVFATNDPYAGGSHLPDVTVVTPVHDSLGRLMFFVASRAHHAEIGGMTPGSMPPHSKTLADEGVLIRNQKIVERGEPRFAELRDLLASGPYPSRDIATNLADIEAQVAANRQGVLDLLTMVDRYSLPIVEHYMNLIQDAAEQKVREALSKLPDGRHEFTDFLETADGKLVPIHVTWTIHKTQRSEFTLNNAQRRPQVAATIDFTGTGGADEGNLNANRAIVTAAVIYVLRLLLDEDIPLNHGVLRPLEIILPRCLLNPVPGPTPETSPAVAGGNVETSQRVVDVLLGALGVAAASQGTMNNVIFGDDRFGYYETICGGSGATADGHGASAVQVHMTNTRLTDPEILERRFPVRVREFALRHHSGGSGYHRGGDGVVRRLEFLRPLTVSLLTQRRGNHPPFGMAGGRNGAVGRNALLRRTGGQVDLPAIAQIEVEEGDVLVIETPGGGGFGTPPSES